jgi:predicted phosphodiesterase
MDRNVNPPPREKKPGTRLLLLSDTHGALAQIDELSARVGADAVLHAGDFGFYDDGSVDRLEARELFLRVIHSNLPDAAKKQAKKLSGDKMRSFIKNELPLSDLGAWLREGRGFRVPVYAVWGNHEDRVVIEDLLAKKTRVENLHLLHDAADHRVGPFELFGLGGNIVPGLLGDQPSPLAGKGGKVWTTLAQIGGLAMAMQRPKEPGTARVLVSHLSPGREPLLGHLCARLGVDLTVSGHMGSPWTAVWEEFSVRNPEESVRRLLDAQAALAPVLEAPLPEDPRLRAQVEQARSLLASLPEPVVDERGAPMPRWYRGCFNVNLPDVPDGYAVLTESDGRLSLETVSRGLLIPT